MNRVARGVVFLWATAPWTVRAADDAYRFGGLANAPLVEEPHLSATPLDAYAGTTAAIHGGNAAGSLNSSELLNASSLHDAFPPISADSSSATESVLRMSPTSGDWSLSAVQPPSSTPQTLGLNAMPPEFAVSRSSGPRLGPLVIGAGVVLAGLLIVGAVTAAGMSRTA